MPRLIVNADDFGLTAGVNHAIIELHRSGLLSSTTLMARAAATNEAIGLALQTPSLGVGCHVVLVDGVPVLPADRIPSLIDQRTGLFHATIGTFLAHLVTGRLHPEEIEAEAGAQIALLQSRGLKLTHIDTHKHTHMFSAVLRAVLRAADAAGIGAIRNPFEPAWAVRATAGAGLTRRLEVTLLRSLRRTFLRLITETGFATTGGALAVAGTGALDAAMVRTLISRLPEGIWELVTHPGYNDADLARVRTRLRGSREAEFQALTALRDFPILDLVDFSALVAG